MKNVKARLFFVAVLAAVSPTLELLGPHRANASTNYCYFAGQQYSTGACLGTSYCNANGDWQPNDLLCKVGVQNQDVPPDRS